MIKYIDDYASQYDWQENENDNVSSPSCEECGSPDIQYAYSEKDEDDITHYLKCNECRHEFDASLR